MTRLNLLEMSWKDVEAYLKKRTDIILPIGSVEEHGYHLPLSTDGDIALAIAKELSKRTGVIVGPIVWYGVCNTTRAFPGTVTADFDSFKSYLASVFLSLWETSFRTVYVISGHLGGSHVSALKEASRKSDLEVLFLDLRKIDSKDILETMPFHAGEAETSLMLFLHPERADMSRAVDEDIEFLDFSTTASVKLTKSGVWGSATKATADKGGKLFSRIIETFEQAFD
jgi:creatinine amidohydrolase